MTPASQKCRAVLLAHESHQGVSMTKVLIRSKVWFPGIDATVEDTVGGCEPCKANINRQRAERLNMSVLPCGPWLKVSIDFRGPLPSGQYLMLLYGSVSQGLGTTRFTNLIG